MRIWVDADATPRAIKDMLFRAAARTGIELVLVANRPLRLPQQRGVRQVVVSRGFDVADEHIVDEVDAGDLVVTQDIPLAAAVVARGAIALEPRGELIDARNAAARLSVRDFMETVRLSGEDTGGPRAFSDRDKRRFAGELDRWLARVARERAAKP